MASQKIEIDGEIYYHESVVNELSQAVDDLSRRVDQRGKRIDKAIAQYNRSNKEKAKWWKFWKR